MPRPRIGAHVSAAVKLSNGILRAVEIGAECIQIFGASPRAWAVRGHAASDIEEFKRARSAAGIAPVFLHASYWVNLASPESAIRQKSEVNLASHLKIADNIGAEGLIFHVGSGKELPKHEALEIVVGSIKRILSYVKGGTRLVIETSAGGGAKIASSPEEIGDILARVKSPRLKVCWDTAHAFEAGRIERYDKANVGYLVGRLHKSVGIQNVVALHVNDSKTPFNSRHDRHENLGEGYIGIDGFRALAGEKRLHHAAWILEVPGFDGEGPDKRNIEILKNCFQ